MRLRLEQLAEHLQGNKLSPVYYLSGDEPLQMLEAADLIRQAARKQGCEERSVLEVVKGFDWYQLAQTSANLSLFASRRIVELRMGPHKPGKDGAQALVDYVSAAGSEDILLITSNKIDKRTQQGRWFKALDAAGVSLQIWPVEAGRLADWVTQRLRAHGKKIERDAASLIADRVEGNLLAAKQEIEKLILLVDDDLIDSAKVMDAVMDSSRFEVFDLVASCMAGDKERVAKMLQGLKGEGAEAIAIFSAMMWEFRRICSMSSQLASGLPLDRVLSNNYVWQQRKFATTSILKRYTDGQLYSLLRQAQVVDKVMKGAIKANAWDVLENYLFRISGVRLQSLPLS